MGVIISDERLRAMYSGGRGNATARRFARLWAAVFRLGLLPKRWVTLEVAGRRSGRMTRFPLGMAVLDGQRYLVSMLGEDCNWVRNVRAAGGSVVLWRRRPERCRLAEIPVAERPPVIRRYLDQVPGARPHIRVDRHAALAEFEAIAPGYPVFRVIPAAVPPRRRHWWRRALGGVAALIALAVLAVGLIFKLQPDPAPLALTPGTAAAVAGPLGGTWIVAAGSRAGFRVRESALGFSNETVGRTGAITGSVVISGDTVTSGVFRVDLTTMKVGGRHQPQFADSLGTAEHPIATLTLAQPITLSPAFTSGATVTVNAVAYFAMHGVSRPVRAELSARRDGSALQVAGSIRVTFSEWGIQGPAGFSFLASLASRGSAEFFLVLHRR